MSFFANNNVKILTETAGNVNDLKPTGDAVFAEVFCYEGWISSQSSDDIILPYAERGTELDCDLPTRINIHLGERHHGGGNIRNILLRLLYELLDRLVRFDTELGLGDLMVELGVLGVQAHAHGVYESRQLGQHVPLVDEIGVTVRVDPNPAAPQFHLCGHGLDDIEPQKRLSVSAEHDLGIPLGIADLGDHLLGRRLLSKPEVMPFHEVGVIAYAESAGRRAAVRDIEVQRIPDGIGYLTALRDLPDTEELHGVEARDPGHVIEGKALDLRNRLSRVMNECRFVALAAFGLRR